jgi:FkbM family methyltransferase
MLDIGANIGLWIITYSTILNKNSKIYAFEPQYKIYQCLMKNIFLNNANNVIPYNFGLSDENTTHYMNVDYHQQTNFGAISIVNKHNDNSLQIQCKIGYELNLNNIGFIKIDIEGHEIQALKGLKHTIKKHKPLMFIEIHPNTDSAMETFKLLYNYGYKKVLRFIDSNYLFMF